MDTTSDRQASGAKRSTNSYSTEEWKRMRGLITKLYFEEGKTLKDVRAILEKEHDFRPTERMYKSRLHQWGLDKKKKEHEMLELVRMGMNRKEGDPEPVFNIRGRQVTLGDALHYFNRKGIKDPTTLLVQRSCSSVEPSSPSEVDIQTPDHPQMLVGLPGDSEDETILDSAQGDTASQYDPFELVERPKVRDKARSLIDALLQALNISELGDLVPFRMLSVESAIPRTFPSTAEMEYMEAMLGQTLNYYQSVFASRNVSADHSTWTATSDNSLSDQFYYDMYHGYSFLWNGQHDSAFQNFDRAFNLIQKLLQENDVAFLIYIYDLIIRYAGTGQEDPLLRLLDFLANMALTVFKNENHPIRLIALWMKQAEKIRSLLAEFTLRRLLEFFQDSIGYFHPETMALLQIFASGLMNLERYQEAAVRYQQLVDAFETTYGKHSYEVCYALRSTSEAYFHRGEYKESLQALQSALERSQPLPREEEREIYVRCIRGMAEIFLKIGRLAEGTAAMQHVVDVCMETWGAEHPFTKRAEMHLKSFTKSDKDARPAMPPTIYRLGRGGRAAKAIWTSTSSPLPLQP